MADASARTSGPPAPSPPRPPPVRSPWPWVVLALGLLATAVALALVYRANALQRTHELQEQARLVAAMVERRVGRWSEILLGMRGLFAASQSVDAGEFNEFFRQLDLPRRYRGFLSLQYLAHVPGARRDAFEDEVRRDPRMRPPGAPAWRIHPPGVRSEHFVTLFVEPMAGNEAAYGFDAAHDAQRRVAFERARDSGRLTASGPLRLVQRPQGGVGYILRQPVYRAGAAQDSVAARRAALVGMGAVVLAMDDFITATIDPHWLAQVDLRLHDLGWVDAPRQAPTASNLLFDNRGPRPPPGVAPAQEIELPLGDRLWRFEFRPRAGAGTAARGAGVEMLVAALGGLASALAFALVRAQLQARAALEQRVARRTAQLAGAQRSLAGAQRSLAESESQLDLALAGADLGLWHWEVASGRITCNDRWLQLRGMARSRQGPGMADWAGCIHPVDRAAVTAALCEHVRGHSGHYAAEYRVLRPGAGTIWVLDRGRVLERDAAGRALRVTGTSLDISDRKRAEEARVAAQTARRLAAAKDEFVGRMSHELRTPLNAILGFSRLLEAAGPDDPRRRAGHVAQIRRAGEHLLALLSDLLDVAAIDAGHLALEPVQLPLAAAVDEVLEMLGPQADDAGVRLAPTEGEACACADRTRLRQVLLNLVGNAIKYNRPGGSVRVRLAPAGDLARIEVQDTGPGLTPAQVARLFQPFERLDARRSGIAGTGLGLVVSQRLVQRMGGQLEVVSRPGEGSCFIVTLPAGA